MFDPTDGPQWRKAICAFSPEASRRREELIARNADYTAPPRPSFFAAIEDFILDLKCA